jgi:hypothetical protein
MKRDMIAAVCVLMIAGCASMTPEAERVRVVRVPSEVRTVVGGCASLGEITTTATMLTSHRDSSNHERRLRNEAAARGGDTLWIYTEQMTWGSRVVANGEAFRCSNAARADGGPAPARP